MTNANKTKTSALCKAAQATRLRIILASITDSEELRHMPVVLRPE